jgi:hypothetical protein
MLNFNNTNTTPTVNTNQLKFLIGLCILQFKVDGKDGFQDCDLTTENKKNNMTFFLPQAIFSTFCCNE